MSDKTVLLPCPFCGSDAEYDTIPAGALVKCSCCGVELRNGSVGIGWYESRELAAADWNRRAALAQQPAPVAVPSDFALRSRVADLLHLLQFAKIETPSHGDAAQAEVAMNDLERMLAAPTAPVALGQEPVGKVLSEEEMGIHYDRRIGPVVWFGTPKPGFIYAAPPAAEQPAGTTSDQYRAELYDEVWEKARGMGYGNVTMALAELERMKAAEQPDAATEKQILLLNRLIDKDATDGTQRQVHGRR